VVEWVAVLERVVEWVAVLERVVDNYFCKYNSHDLNLFFDNSISLK